MNQFPIREIVFYLFALITLAPAVIVVTTKNIVYAAFALMFTLFGIAGLYVFLSADFLAAVQVLIYVGGILVLILFGVMLTSGALDMKLKVERGQIIPGIIASLVILILLFVVIVKTPWNPLTESQIQQMQSDKDTDTTEEIGTQLIGRGENKDGKVTGEFLLPFEIASVLLLVAIIGAALICRREVKE
jgi:NADH-quinone oxidoreductase subunit J